MSSIRQTKKLREIVVENKKSTLKSKGHNRGEYPFFVSGYNVKSIDKYLIGGSNIYLPTGGNFFVHYFDGRAAYSTDTWSIKTEKSVDIKYLYYFLILNSELITKKLFKGATIKHLQKHDFRNLEIPLLPTEEQKRIIKKLDEVFEKVTKAKEAAEKNLQNSKELFESYLHNVFVNLGKEWEEKTLGEICDIKHGFAFTGSRFKSNLNTHDPIVLTPGNFKEGGGLYFTIKNTKRLRGEYPEEFLFHKGDLVIVMTDLSSKMKILGNPAIIEGENILHNQRIGKVVLKNGIVNKNFLHYYFLTRSFKDNIKKTATGTMVKHTAPKRILENLVPIPESLSEQRFIVKKLDALSVETEKLEKIYEQKIADLEELKKSVLQKAFEGEL